MRRDTGFPVADAESDFLRARRRQVLSRLAAWLRREPDDVNIMLPFDEVVGALGRAGERRLGLQVIRLDTIVGSVDRTRDFDRRFRPTSARVRERWQRLALATRRGESVPPIDVYRVGELHFVQDGHHRVSVAHALGLRTIDAYVTEVLTRIDPHGIRFRGDLIVKDYRRIFLERVPLPGEARAAVVVTDPWDYAELGEAVEAWGFRLMQDEGVLLDRATVARRWYAEEYLPVVRMLEQADLVGQRTEAEAYLWVIGERYRLIRTHRWDEEVIDALRVHTRRRPSGP
ncbi:ParB-like nuclease domain-containing protein [Streptoalloteichus tenebrarius]|uniref:ParB-like nuclease domain-containing protein n=1 Tax=Streptoalloteichus tenebrarius (strain ATCC 17920 / DSM 40477 / JCM 4838 / CBS 697.72 / NBRC 16177 / NCIMB 11028 / NRRL B-12390 / A12253. 1 / ISP 5477) TaxID=1933 RepID=A0ABT1HVL8_STRSD|nr:chromosome partitioning protein ParB [Streptoalloteichus tenebrarius]MCP2259579.1 ParB-like nuclease domain-containing protein [Streptoalloteichus tenebrarius]BFF01014.1 ParB N-terminal domain-containing protein [Streptoalloteichus tenebrarius]